MGSLAKKPGFVPAAEMARGDYAAITRADPALAWAVFADCSRWHRFTDLYGELRWTQGTPWTPGSRLRMELLHPAKFTVSRVITLCRPGECAAWIDHCRGSTMEQWFTLQPEPDGVTSVRIASQGIAAGPKVAGQPFDEFLKNNVKRWLDAFCQWCDRVRAEGG